MSQTEVPLRCTGVAVVLLKPFGEECKLLLLRRNSKVLQNVWCYIGGSIEEGEAAWEAALREVEEETGLKSISLYTSTLFDQIYSPAEDYIYLAPVFVGYVEGTGQVKLNDEHSEFKWVTFEEAFDTVSLPGNEEVLRSVEKYFAKRSPLHHLRITS
ncbi:NUDIX domain-containing protein [Halobacillus fulvus]|nr:NUDIX domain-containing protein [Halobacillus fulvus]